MKQTENQPRTRVIQADAYADAGQPGFAFNIPQPFTAEMFADAAEVTGANATGLATANNQLLAENLGNNMASRIKKAVKDNTALPSQDDMDTLYETYDFSGVRSSALAQGSLFDRILFKSSGAFIRRLVKKNGYQEQAAPVTVARKGAEAEATEISYDTFEMEVGRLMHGEGPWGESEAFMDLREELIAAARAEEERERAAATTVESKLVELGSLSE